MRAQGQWSTTDTTSLDYYHLTIGGHIYRSDTLIFGAMAQTDSAKATLEAGDFKGRGWLAGPYVVARLPDQPIYFSASLLHGKTTNSLTLTGWPTDDFSSTRTLFTAGLEGRYTFESGLTLIPSFDVARLSEHQKSYTDSQNNVVRAQTIRQSNASLGLSFEKPLSLSHGDLLLTGGIAGVYSAQQAPGASRHSQHGRMELGALYAIDPMTSLSVSAIMMGSATNHMRLLADRFGLKCGFEGSEETRGHSAFCDVPHSAISRELRPAQTIFAAEANSPAPCRY